MAFLLLLFELVVGIFMIGCYLSGLFLAFSQSIITGVIIFLIPTAPAVVGVVNALFHINLALKLHQLLGV